MSDPHYHPDRSHLSVVEPGHREHECSGRKPGFLSSLFLQRCPRCRTGRMFKTGNPYDLRQFMKMPERCPECSQLMEIEVGFYYGTSYVSYAMAVAFSVATCIAWWVLIGFSLNDGRFFWWMGTNMVLLVLVQPYLMRLSRTIWLSFFVRYNENWRMERPDEPERLGSRPPSEERELPGAAEVTP